MRTKIFLIVFTGVILLLSTDCKKEERVKLMVLSSAPVTNITPTTAKSGGILTFIGKAEIYTNGVCWNTTGNPSTADTRTVDVIGNPQFVSRLSGLTAATRYYVRAYATNSAGTAYGDELTFTTLGSAPGATTQPAKIITAGAILNGTVNANELSTIITFEYGNTVSYGQEITAPQSPVTGNTNTDVSATLTRLTAGTYHFRVKAVNSLGTVYGNDVQFTIGPTAETLAATIDTTGVIFKGLVNANHLSTTVAFEYGTTAGYGQEVRAEQSPVTGNTNTIVSATLTGLTEGTYHFRVKADNYFGIVYGNDVEFYLDCQPPTVSTLTATVTIYTISIHGKGGPTVKRAKLEGIVNANGLPTTVSFEWGPTVVFGKELAAIQSPVTGYYNTSVSATVQGLEVAANFFFRVKAVNSLGTVYGETLSF